MVVKLLRVLGIVVLMIGSGAAGAAVYSWVSKEVEAPPVVVPEPQVPILTKEQVERLVVVYLALHIDVARTCLNPPTTRSDRRNKE